MEGISQHRHLSGVIAGLSQTPPQGVFDADNAWSADRGREVGNGGKRDGRETRRFDFALHQSHGPATDRSGRDQNDDIGEIFP